jgi:hypothetical protein
VHLKKYRRKLMPNGRNSSRPKLTGQESKKAKNRINIINGKMQVLML